jgi:hypothetical protein
MGMGNGTFKETEGKKERNNRSEEHIASSTCIYAGGKYCDSTH